MINLLKKEFGLTGALVTYCFIATGLFALIPNYPILVSTMISAIGIIATFQLARESHDVAYLATLPIKKRDVVKAKFLFVTAIELITFSIMTIVVILRFAFMSKATPYVNNALMNANLAFLGYALISYAIFNFVFLSVYYKTAYSFVKPSILFFVIYVIFLFVCEALHFFPSLKMLNATTVNVPQLIVLLIGIVVYLIATFASYFISAREFEKIDL